MTGSGSGEEAADSTMPGVASAARLALPAFSGPPLRDSHPAAPRVKPAAAIAASRVRIMDLSSVL
jgi:hypothetical protein